MRDSSFSSTRSKHIPRIPASAVVVISDNDENDDQTSTAKAILREPENLAGYTYRVEMDSSAVTVAQITNLLAELSHENILQVYGMGDSFVVTSFWNETLLSRLTRIKELQTSSENNRDARSSCTTSLKLFKRNRLSSKSQQEVVTTPALNLWQHVALPVTRALLHLHQQHVTLGGLLDLTSIVLLFGDGIMLGPPQVYLRDFSKAKRATQVAAYTSDIDDLLLEDVFRLGIVFNELALVQPLPFGDPANNMDKMIESCCQEDPFLRPSIRRIHKRLLEILRHLPPSVPAVQGSWAPVPDTFIKVSDCNEYHSQLRVPLLTGFGSSTSSISTCGATGSSVQHHSHDVLSPSDSPSPRKDSVTSRYPENTNQSVITSSTASSSFLRSDVDSPWSTPEQREPRTVPTSSGSSHDDWLPRIPRVGIDDDLSSSLSHLYFVEC